MNRTPYNDRLGLSMIEVIVSTLLISTILIVSLTASSNLLRNRAVANEGTEGELLAFQYLDEITSLAFTDPDANALFGCEPNESASTRVTLDDVDDYHALTLSPPTNRAGLPLTNFAGWTVAIAVTPLDATNEGFALSADPMAPLRRINVSCISPSGKSFAAELIVSHVPSTFAGSTLHQRRRELSLAFPNGQQLNWETPLRNRPAGSGS